MKDGNVRDISETPTSGETTDMHFLALDTGGIIRMWCKWEEGAAAQEIGLTQLDETK